MKKSVCKVCHKNFKYDDRIQKGIYCNNKCRYEDHGNIIKNSYTPELIELRSKHAKLQMQKKEQIRIRKEKCGKGMTEEVKQKVSDANTKDAFKIAKKIIVQERGAFCERCGVALIGKELLVHHKNGHKWDQDLDNLQILCKSCHSKIHNEWGREAGKYAGKAKVANYIAKILVEFGIDLDHPDFKGTPLRVARMYEDLFSGIKEEKNIEDIFQSVFPTNNSCMVVETGIKVYSLCPHHLLPVDCDISIAYIPNKKAVGLSKLCRISEILARQPIIQENLTVKICEVIQKYLKPQGVMVYIKARHYCMVMRGTKKENVSVSTSHITGIFEKSTDTRNEALKLFNLQ